MASDGNWPKETAGRGTRQFVRFKCETIKEMKGSKTNNNKKRTIPKMKLYAF